MYIIHFQEMIDYGQCYLFFVVFKVDNSASDTSRMIPFHFHSNEQIKKTETLSYLTQYLCHGIFLLILNSSYLIKN